MAAAVLKSWKEYPSSVRVDAVNLLAGRKEWARQLLAAVGRKEVARTDLNDNTILRIRALRDRSLNEQIEKVWGRVREQTPAELNRLINRMRAALEEGRGSFERGRKVFENQCAKCHRFEGKGHDVGPNLDGAARDIDYLLVNVLDPNRVVGQPYYTRFVALKNGRIETGLLHAEDEQSVTLKNENDSLKIILRKDIDEITTQEKSLMPEGLNKNMTEQDFRDLIRFVMANPYLTDVAVAGPLDRKSPVTIDKGRPLRSKGLAWMRPAVGVAGKVALPTSNSADAHLVYITAEVTAPQSMRTSLQISTGAAIKVWLNGKMVMEITGQSSADQGATDVDLDMGVNQLLFEVASTGRKQALFARLLDPQRKLRYSEPKTD
jgi:putative heme-binding domain-containing protein